MKTNVNAATTAQVAKQSKQDVNKANHTPLYIMHTLNKLAKGVTGISEKSEALKELQRRCGCGPKGFTYDQLKQHEGRICRMRPYNGQFTWNAVITTYVGTYELVPVPTTENGIINALKSYAEYREKVAADLLADKSTKSKKWTKKELFAALKAGELTQIEFVELYEKVA